MTAPAVTPWQSVKTPPLADRPGRYQCQYGGPKGVIRFAQWDGQRWDDEHIKAVYGDAWRGCTQPAQG